MIKMQSVNKVAKEVLQKEHRPIHYKELTQMIIGKCKLRGKTPHETVRSLISKDPDFKRTAEGVYGLSEWTEYPEARFAKDIAYDVLKSRNYPMTLIELGEAIFKEREFVGSYGQVVRNAIRQDKRFYYDPEKNLVGLTEWQN